MKKILVLGQGYVGLPISLAVVSQGMRVLGVETSIERLSSLERRISYIEDVKDQDIEDAFSTGRFAVTSDLGEFTEFDVAVITVPTPLRSGVPDLSHVEDAAKTISSHITVGSTVILESTTYPGTTEELLIPILESGSNLRAGIDFYVGYSPERIDPGNKTWTLANTPKIISGVNEESLNAVRSFYELIVEKVIPVSTTKVAELVKLLENTFRHVNIALVNELAMFAHELDVDVWEAIEAASTKPYGFMPFMPGPGVGGHCLPIDPSYLSWKIGQELGQAFQFVELANRINQHMPEYVAKRADSLLKSANKSLRNSIIVVIGVTYKKNSRDARESPGPIICEKLANAEATVLVCEPNLEPTVEIPNCIRVDLDAQLLEEADLVVIVTDHDAIDWDLVESSSKLVLDCRNRLSPSSKVSNL